ncbi:MAG: tetratricopeptide repeat protein [Planctomycetes bacterium]|nr:tetratricopeptide repeat protein [Planctomycetota bacterium]
MAGRVNTKFVMILLAILVVVTGVLGAAWYFATLKDPAEYIAKGDVMMSQGQYDEAQKWYGRAFRLDRTSPVIMMKYTEASSKMPVTTTHDLNERLMQMTQMWSKVITVAPDSAQATEARQKLMAYYYDAAKTFNQIAMWDRLYGAAVEMLSQTGNAESLLARKYRGIAQVQRMRRLDVEAGDRKLAKEDLDAALKESPDDAELSYAVAQWYLFESLYEQRAGRAAESKKLADEGVKIAKAYLDAHPKSIDAQLNLMRVLLITRDNTQAEVMLASLEKQMMQIDDIDNTLEIGQFIITIDRKAASGDDNDADTPTGTTSGRMREEKLLRHLLEKHPDDVLIQYKLADNLIYQNRRDEAVPLLISSIADRPMTPSIKAQYEGYVQLLAISKLGDLYLSQREVTTDEQVRASLLDKTRQLLEQMKTRASESSGSIDLLEGKIALAEGNYALADQKLNAANEKSKGDNPEASILQAKALQQLGQLGAARDRLAQAIESPIGKRYWPAYRELAILELQLHEDDKAMEYVQALLNAMPTDPAALQLKAAILASQYQDLSASGSPEAAKKLHDAIGILETMPKADDRPVRLQLAKLYQAEGRGDEVRLLLEPLLEKDPTDFIALRQLLQVDLAEGKKEAAIARIDTALKAPQDEKIVKVLHLIRDRLAGTGDLQGQVEELLAAQDDPFQRAMWLYAFYKRTGEAGKAEDAIKQAESLKPNDASVLRARLDAALSEADWTKAEAIADRASKLNLDEAQGMFWVGEVEMARARYTQAVATLNRGVSLRPRYSEGWRLLGQARIEAGDLTGADAALTRALELQPNNVSALKAQFHLHDMRHNYQLALGTLSKAVEFAPRDRELFEQYLTYKAEHGDPKEVMAERQKLLAAVPQDMPNRRSLATLYLQMGNTAKAKEVLDALMKEHPEILANVLAMADFYAATGDTAAGQKLLVNYIGSLGEKAGAEDWLTLARYLRDAKQTAQAEAAYRRGIAVEDPKIRPATRELGDWYFARNEHMQAAELYKPLLEATHDPRVARRLIETLVRSGQFEAARDALTKFITEHGQDVQTALLEGLIYSNMGAAEADRANRAFDRAVQLGPSNAQAYLYRARYHFNSDDDQTQNQVKADLQKAIALDPAFIPARQMLVTYYLDPRRGDDESAMIELRRLIDQAPDMDEARVQLAQLYLKAKRYPDLDRLLDESVKMLPNATVWYQLRARSLRDQGRSADALAELAKAYKQRPDPSTLYAYSLSLLEAKESQAALDVLNKASSLTDRSAVLSALRARAVAALGDAEKAVGLFTAAFELTSNDPTQINELITQMRAVLSEDQMVGLLQKRADADPTGMTDLLIAQLQLQKGEQSQAITRLEALTGRLDPKSDILSSAQQLLAAAYFQGQQYDKTWGIYQKVLERQPDNFQVLNNSAYILAEQLHRPADALPMAEKAVKLAPKQALAQASILDTLGWVQYRNGNLDQAEITLRRSIQLNPLAPVHLHLAQLLLERGQKDDARQQINAARRLAEDAKDADSIKQSVELMKKVDEGAAEGAPKP